MARKFSSEKDIDINSISMFQETSSVTLYIFRSYSVIDVRKKSRLMSRLYVVKRVTSQTKCELAARVELVTSITNPIINYNFIDYNNKLLYFASPSFA